MNFNQILKVSMKFNQILKVSINFNPPQYQS